tara:strand:- start:4738 stop:5988 length:1251 start_codon:yes stop_codon:yes gene_type:complete
MIKNNNKVTILSSLGAGFEYYDFIIFALMSGTLSSLFYAQVDNEVINIMKTFMVFALGYVARPIGGILFAAVGDKSGRKKSFLSIMFLMAGASLLIGCLPTYDVIGGIAPMFLIILRIVQGISFGAELPGAITMVAEHTDKNKRGAHTSFIISSVSLGSVMATLVAYLLNKFLDPQQVLAWGWRIPFLLGGVLAIINYFIRKGIDETPEFINAQKVFRHKNYLSPMIHLLKGYKLKTLQGIVLTAGTSILIITNLFFPIFLNKIYAYEKSDIFSGMTLGVLWCALVIPFFGKLADKKGAGFSYKIGILSALFFLFPLLKLLEEGTYMTLVFFLMAYQTIIAALMAGYMPLMVELFPVKIRQTGISVCYNITYAIMGGAPFVYTYAGALENANIIIYCISGVSFLALAAVYRVRDIK